MDNVEKLGYQDPGSMPGLEKLAKDMKLTGIGYIITGIIQCLGIISAVIGIPMIIAGLRAQDSSKRLENYLRTGRTEDIGLMYEELGSHFRMTKIYFIVTLVFAVLAIIGYALFFSIFFGAIMGEMQNM